MKRTIKLAAEAFKPANLARGLNAARNPPSQAEIDAALEHATPEQRAAYAGQVARAEAGAQQAYEHKQAREAAAARAVRAGRGRGLRPRGADAEQIAGKQRCVAALRPHRAGPPDQADRRDGAGARRRSREIEDPGERAQHAAQERAERDQARAPYRAPRRVPIHISRLSTRGKTQLDEVLALPQRQRAGAGPHLRRLPRPGPHQPGADAAFGEGPAGRVGHRRTPTRAARRRRSSRRRSPPTSSGSRGGSASRRCSTRSSRSRSASAPGSGPSSAPGSRASRSSGRCRRRRRELNPVCTLVRGVVAVHPRDRPDAFERMRAAAPLHLHAPEGIHVEVLNWSAVAAAVHPRGHHPPPVPSPFPYLPPTPQELLRAYLEVVGVRPAGLLQRAGDGPTGAAGAERRAREHRPQAAVRGRQGADARARLRARRVRLPRPPRVRARAASAGRPTRTSSCRPARARDRRPAPDRSPTSSTGMLGKIARAAESSSACTGTTGSRAPRRTPIRYRYCWPPVAMIGDTDRSARRTDAPQARPDPRPARRWRC